MSYSSPLTAVLKKVGGPAALARKLGMTPAAITNWKDVPARHLLTISSLTGMLVEEIRPDLAEEARKVLAAQTPSDSAPPAQATE
jgi:DNA-binding transcriptional regulator YdaS (Cro superfamily)